MNPETSHRYVSNRNPKQAGNQQLLPLHHSVVNSMKPGGRGTDPALHPLCSLPWLFGGAVETSQSPQDPDSLCGFS